MNDTNATVKTVPLDARAQAFHGRKGKQSLGFGELYALFNSLCRRRDLKPPSRMEVMEMYFSSVPRPIIAQSDTVRLWLDKYYAACREGEGDIKYLYISRYHISEEIGAVKEQRLTRGFATRLPNDIIREFKTALGRMNEERVKYVVTEW